MRGLTTIVVFSLAESFADDYIYVMQSILPFLLGFAIFATLIILVVGLVNFAKNGPFYQKYANKMLRARVIGQALALIILAIIMGLASAG